METDAYFPHDWLPIVIQFAAALGFVVITMLVTHWIGPKRRSTTKHAAFESGLESIGNARTPISYKYFMTAILFVLFDVEIIFLYPWAVNFRALGFEVFAYMMIFIGVLLAGLYYELKKGIL
jgi:NADH-quinone oxidoreductase subunit A